MESIIARCQDTNDKTRIDPQKIEGFIKALNDSNFEKYDCDCDGRISESERATHDAEVVAEAGTKLDESIKSVDKRTKDSIAAARVRGIEINRAHSVLPDPAVKTFGFNTSYLFKETPKLDSKALSIELSREQKPWKSFSGTVPISIGLHWKLTAKQESSTTADNQVRTRTMTLTPFAFKSTDPDERYTFKLGIGAGHIWTRETIRATGVQTEAKEFTYTYTADLSYVIDPAKCWTIGLSYELNTRKPFSSEVSKTFGPKVGYSLLCLTKSR